MMICVWNLFGKQISSLNLLRVISEQEGCAIEELNAGKVCDWFVKDKLKREQNLDSAVLQWDDSDSPFWPFYSLLMFIWAWPQTNCNLFFHTCLIISLCFYLLTVLASSVGAKFCTVKKIDASYLTDNLIIEKTVISNYRPVKFGL